MTLEEINRIQDFLKVKMPDLVEEYGIAKEKFPHNPAQHTPTLRKLYCFMHAMKEKKPVVVD